MLIGVGKGSTCCRLHTSERARLRLQALPLALALATNHGQLYCSPISMKAASVMPLLERRAGEDVFRKDVQTSVVAAHSEVSTQGTGIDATAPIQGFCCPALSHTGRQAICNEAGKAGWLPPRCLCVPCTQGAGPRHSAHHHRFCLPRGSAATQRSVLDLEAGTRLACCSNCCCLATCLGEAR